MTHSGFSIISQRSIKSPALGEAVPSTSTSMGHDAVQSCNCHSTKCFLYAAGFVLGGAAIGYFIGYKLAMRRARVNAKVQLANDKVVDTVDVEDIGEKKAFCRCWKSEKVGKIYCKF
ncbi:hypothetical protein OSTOST_05107 [Ostertagia ostertagi]